MERDKPPGQRLFYFVFLRVLGLRGIWPAGIGSSDYLAFEVLGLGGIRQAMGHGFMLVQARYLACCLRE